jgi:glycosyltransferase involved in cell wall biosynthesis
MTSAVGTSLRVIAYVADGVFNSVLDSQIVVPLGLLGTQAPEVRRALLVLTSYRHRLNPKRAAREQSIRAALPGVYVAFAFRPNVGAPFEHYLWNRALRATMKAANFSGDGAVIVHCRGEATAAAAGLLKRRDPRVRVLLDLRGAAEDEANRLNWVAPYFRWSARRARRLAFSQADGLNAVSTKLIDHTRQSGLLVREIPQSVVGCCADTTRFHFDPTIRAQRRSELNLGDKFVLCYCGSMAGWQRPDVVAEAFARLLPGMPDAHLLIVSHESEILTNELRGRGVDLQQITTCAARHDQVASYLMAADVGLLLRENSLTNRVASPVKFAEYLRCGLPVILTPYIGDLSEIAVREGVGATVEFPPAPAEMLAAASGLRARLTAEGDGYRAYCSRLAGERFSWDTQIMELVRLYQTLSTGSD